MRPRQIYDPATDPNHPRNRRPIPQVAVIDGRDVTVPLYPDMPPGEGERPWPGTEEAHATARD